MDFSILFILNILYIEKILYIEVAVSVQKNVRIADITPLCICSNI